MNFQEEVRSIISKVESSQTVRQGVDILIRSLGTLIDKAAADPGQGLIGGKLMQHAGDFATAVEANTAAALTGSSAPKDVPKDK